MPHELCTEPGWLSYREGYRPRFSNDRANHKRGGDGHDNGQRAPKVQKPNDARVQDVSGDSRQFVRLSQEGFVRRFIVTSNASTDRPVNVSPCGVPREIPTYWPGEGLIPDRSLYSSAQAKGPVCQLSFAPLRYASWPAGSDASSWSEGSRSTARLMCAT